MSPLYLSVILITAAFIPPSLGQGYGPLPHKGKKHRTTTTTTLPPDIANLNLDGPQYQPGYNPSTPLPDNSLGSYNQPSPPQGGNSFWWQNPNSPFNGANTPQPSPQQPPAPAGGCGGGSAGCGGGSPPINMQGNPFLSGLRPGGAPITPSGQAVACQGSGYTCAAKHLCVNGVVNDNGQDLFQVRSEVQYCDAATQVCCRLPSAPGGPSGCGGGGYGPGGSCGGAPGNPSQPGLVHLPPTQGRPPQPGFTQPGPPPFGGNNNGGGGLIHIPPSQSPSYPTNAPHYPSASIPSPSYAPGNNYNNRPIPGNNGVPIGGSIYDTTGRPVTQNPHQYPVTQSPNQYPYTGPLNTTPHPGCAAALKCVLESYCTAEGVMVNQPVTLTREQYENRVPLSDCAHPDTGVLGKCCRDPNYKDPWPGGMMMMKNNGGGQQPDECGPGAACLHSYQCGNENRLQPARGCRVPLDGASGVCCSSNGQGSLPSGQYPGTTPVAQKPHKKPTTGYPSPNPSVQTYPQQFPSSPFPQPSQPIPSAQPFYPKPVKTPPPQPQPSYPQPQPTQPRPHPQPLPAQPQPSYPQPQPTQPRPSYPQPQPTRPQPSFPQPQPTQHQPSYPQPQPTRPQPSFPQPQPTQPQPSYPQQQPTQPRPQPQPQPQFPRPPQPQPQFPAPRPTQPQPQYPSQPSPGYPQPTPGYPQPSPGYPQSVGPKPGAECGIRRQVSRQGLNGDDAGFGEFPWQALVVSKSNNNPLCSAAIISDNAVITAAHCLQNVESSDILVHAGVWKLNSNSQPKPIQVVPVAAIARHPNFDASSLFNDLTILILSQPLKYDEHVDKICLPPRGQDVTQYKRGCIATGWGKNALQGNIPGSILHQVPVRLVDQASCEDTLRQSHLGRYFILNPSFQCAVPTSPTQDLCKVDAGGPVACDRGDGHHVLSGTYSWDIGCNAPNSPTVLGGIDTDWIESVLARPVDDLIRDELNGILKQQQQQELEGVDIDNKPGFSQGYGKK